ncbi:unnamed protein product [Closterium sp. NIES-53]
MQSEGAGRGGGGASMSAAGVADSADPMHPLRSALHVLWAADNVCHVSTVEAALREEDRWRDVIRFLFFKGLHREGLVFLREMLKGGGVGMGWEGEEGTEPVGRRKGEGEGMEGEGEGGGSGDDDDGGGGDGTRGRRRDADVVENCFKEYVELLGQQPRQQPLVLEALTWRFQDDPTAALALLTSLRHPPPNDLVLSLIRQVAPHLSASFLEHLLEQTAQAMGEGGGGEGVEEGEGEDVEEGSGDGWRGSRGSGGGGGESGREGGESGRRWSSSSGAGAPGGGAGGGGVGEVQDVGAAASQLQLDLVSLCVVSSGAGVSGGGPEGGQGVQDVGAAASQLQLDLVRLSLHRVTTELRQSAPATSAAGVSSATSAAAAGERSAVIGPERAKLAAVLQRIRLRLIPEVSCDAV